MKKKIEKYTYYTPEWQDYLNALEKSVQTSAYLPKFHLYPKTGLMNDPNGLNYFNGKYHVFYQWFPFDSFHGMKHWGHATSQDLVTFKDEDLAIIPEQEYEKSGAYSGNSFEHDGKLYLYYTANYKTEAGKVAKQALAIMDKDGTIAKSEDNPIIDGAPVGFSQELRDPFVFERDGQFCMLLGGGSFIGEERAGFGDTGELLLYKSQDLLKWEYKGTIDLPIDKGYMLECPSLVTIDGKDVLFLSPMGYEKETYRFQNRFAAMYLVGQLDVDKLTFEVDTYEEIDAGFDYYAPQSFHGKDNVPIAFGWFGCGEQVYPIDDESWKHGLTTAQEMRLVDGKLLRFPTEDTLAYFGKKETLAVDQLTLANPFYHLEFTLNTTKDLQIRFGNEDDYWELRLDSNKQLVTIDRGYLKQSIDIDYGFTRSTDISNLSEEITADIFVDNSFVELYLNKGEKVFSFRTFLAPDNNTITFSEETPATWSYFEEKNQ